jgi:hypothetical protein
VICVFVVSTWLFIPHFVYQYFFLGFVCVCLGVLLFFLHVHYLCFQADFPVTPLLPEQAATPSYSFSFPRLLSSVTGVVKTAVQVSFQV